MLNLAIGNAFEDAGRSLLRTVRGPSGHAVYGPYEYREAGTYAVEFGIRLKERPSALWDNIAVVIDVVRDTGSDVVAVRRIRLSELTTERSTFRLDFTLGERSKLEYRIWTSGAAELELEEYRRVVRLDAPVETLPIEMLDAFPEADETQPEFFRANLPRFRHLYDRGFQLGFTEIATVLAHDGISFNVREEDDFTFIGEVFAANVYNFITDAPTCAIDVGMNIGFSTLQFARKPNVREVHSFEPFPSTYRRAVENLALNPSLAAKVTHACVGLSDRDWQGEVAANSANNSGSNSVVFSSDGPSSTVSLADAGTTLAPIVDAARAGGMRVVVKIDCEGSEFAIFKSLAEADLFRRIDAVMVEWHALFDRLNQKDLIRPLLAAGFLVFDQSPTVGNGFFYGVRMAGAD